MTKIRLGVLLFSVFVWAAWPPFSSSRAQAQSTTAQQKRDDDAAKRAKQQQQKALQQQQKVQQQQQKSQQQPQKGLLQQQQKADRDRLKAQQQQQKQAQEQQKKLEQQRKAQQQREEKAQKQKAEQEQKAQQQKAQQEKKTLQQQQKQQEKTQQQQKLDQQKQQREAERIKRQETQKLKRERAEKQKTQALEREKQRQALSKQRRQEKAQLAQKRKDEQKRRAELRKRSMAQNKAHWLDRRRHWHDRPRLTPRYAYSSRFIVSMNFYGDGWYALSFGWSPWRAWRAGYVATFIPWSGPVFWPYIYEDVFSYTFWPAAYDGGYWAYAYDDLIDSAFYPAGASYAEAALPPPATDARPKPRPGAEAAAERACANTGKGITSWPIGKIERAVQPTPEQQDLLDALREAALDAATDLKESCPTSAASTPPERMQATADRLQATLEAVKAVRPALTDFYMSLSDEQKARFDAALAPKVKSAQTRPAQAPEQTSCSEAKTGLATYPAQQLEDALKPDEDQQFLLDDLEEAAGKAVEILQRACPDAVAPTPVERLEAMEKRLQAMVDAANVILPAVEDFYASLSEQQKARYNALGKQVAR